MLDAPHGITPQNPDNPLALMLVASLIAPPDMKSPSTACQESWWALTVSSVAMLRLRSTSMGAFVLAHAFLGDSVHGRRCLGTVGDGAAGLLYNSDVKYGGFLKLGVPLKRI